MGKIIIIFIMVFLLFGCAQQEDEDTSEPRITENNVPKEIDNNQQEDSEGEDQEVVNTNIEDDESEVSVEGENQEIDETSSPEPEDEITVKENLINGKNLEQRLEILRDNLHKEGSGDQAKEFFPDFEVVYIDQGDPLFPDEILPFVYHYSKEADITVSICNVDYTVFVCNGRLDRLIQESDYENCLITKEYLHPGEY